VLWAVQCNQQRRLQTKVNAIVEGSVSLSNGPEHLQASDEIDKVAVRQRAVDAELKKVEALPDADAATFFPEATDLERELPEDDQTVIKPRQLPHRCSTINWSDEITADCPRKQANNLNDIVSGPIEGGLRSIATKSSDRPKLLACGSQRQSFNRVVDLDDLFANVGEDGAAARFAAGQAGDRWLAQRIIDVIDHEPRSAIGHAQMPRCRPNRPFRPNGFKQSYLARTDVVSVGEIEAKPKAGIVHGDLSTG